MMKKINRRFFTLLEALIAAMLAITVLTALGYFYRQIDQINTKTIALQKESFEHRYAEARLAAVLTRAVSERDRKKDFLFFTVNYPGGLFHKDSPTSLLFVYDNLIDLSQHYANHVLGRLYLDPQGNLCLATWPSPKRWEPGLNPPMMNEILMTDVDSLTFSFFIPPKKEWKLEPPTKNNNTNPKKVTVEPGPEGSWIQEWREDYNMLPGIIRVEIKKKGLPIRFAFPLTETSRQIVYTQ